jgi:hypothetical protein
LLRKHRFLIAASFKFISFIFLYLIALFKAIRLETPQPDWIVISVYWVGVPLYTIALMLLINQQINRYKTKLIKT